MLSAMKVCPQCNTYYTATQGHRCAPIPGSPGVFDIHAGPQPGSIAERLEQLRGAINMEFAHTRERSLAQTKLDEAELWLSQAKPEQG
jgi:hypothetical protein